MIPTNYFFFAFFTILCGGCAAASPTAYEVIQTYGFPAGIIPKGITHYDLEGASGKFNGYFNGTCSFSLDGSYQLKYNSRISGYISQNKLTNLSGVTVKVFFLWLNIVEVRRNGDNLEFSVGIASADFPLDNFYDSPECGCGFNCKSVVVDKDLEERNPRTNHPYVSEI